VPSLRELRKREAAAEAERVLRALPRRTVPVDPFAIATAHGIEVKEYDAEAPGFSGALIRRADTFCICYASHIRNPGFRRFTVAHELGHYFLPGHPEHLLAQSDTHRSRAGFASDDDYEAQADHFAACLLMPRDEFVAAAREQECGLSAVSALQSRFEVSLTAASIRYAALTEYAVAAILSDGASILSCNLSEELAAVPGVRHLRRASAIANQTATRRCVRSAGGHIATIRAEDCVNLRCWFDDAPDVDAYEQVVGLGGYGRVLTILSVDTADLDDEG